MGEEDHGIFSGKLEHKVYNSVLYFGPSGVRALPLAAGINEGGHYFRYIIPLLVVGVVTTVIKTPEGVVVGFPNFAWAPN